VPDANAPLASGRVGWEAPEVLRPLRAAELRWE